MSAETTSAPATSATQQRFQKSEGTSLGKQAFNLLTTTDHKLIGMMYMGMAFAFFAFGGLLALGIRTELWEPGLQVVVSKDQYNQLFTM
ncbi:MAG: cytochrome ubiquinol oxidase subunit I, partial [Brachybacterium tyrofermentans]